MKFYTDYSKRKNRYCLLLHLIPLLPPQRVYIIYIYVYSVFCKKKIRSVLMCRSEVFHGVGVDFFSASWSEVSIYEISFNLTIFLIVASSFQRIVSPHFVHKVR